MFHWVFWCPLDTVKYPDSPVLSFTSSLSQTNTAWSMSGSTSQPQDLAWLKIFTFKQVKKGRISTLRDMEEIRCSLTTAGSKRKVGRLKKRDYPFFWAQTHENHGMRESREKTALTKERMGPHCQEIQRKGNVCQGCKAKSQPQHCGQPGLNNSLRRLPCVLWDVEQHPLPLPDRCH